MAHVWNRAFFASSCLLALGSLAGCGEMHGVSGGDAGPLSDVELPDAQRLPDGDISPDVGPVLDAWIDPDGGTPSDCTPDDARQLTCPSGICDGPDSYAWDGERCVVIDCGTCTGTACGHLPTSEAACVAAHSTCVAEMCTSTGGQWLFYAQECQHYRCGSPVPAECLVGMPVCNCGDGRSFDAARGGCFDDTCPVVDPLPPQALCTATGGTWTTGICCATRCGQPCDLACAADACTCGPLEIFDPVRGCVDALECHVGRTAGQECRTDLRCADGLICCQHCGGAGCDPTMTCTAPVCDADPTIDECGNLLLAP